MCPEEKKWYETVLTWFSKNKYSLVVSETETSAWNYHLRILDERGFKMGGSGNLISLCGKKMAWDTLVPAETFLKTDRPEFGTYCKECKRKAEELMEGGQK